MPGYECAFIQTVPKSLRCLLCTLPCRNTVLISSCRHKFCETCMETYLRSGVFICPEDRSSLDYAKLYPDPITDSIILSIPVRCPTWNLGCSWTGSLSSSWDHEQECQFSPVKCPNQCVEEFIRKDLSNHLQSCRNRPLACRHCGQLYAHHNIEHHSNHCPQELIHCERKCGALLQRQFLANHTVNQCPKRLLVCPHNCGKQCQFESFSDHFLTCSNFPVKCPYACSSKLIPRADLPAHLKQHTMSVMPCPFREAGCQFKGLQIQLDSHNEDCRDVHAKLLARIVVKQKGHITALTSALQNMQANYDGRLLWKISGFAKKFNQASVKPETQLESPVFYTSQYGYKLQASVFLHGNGEGEGSHISVYVKVIAGPYDALLPWPFCLPITFTLLDQSPDLEKRIHVKESFTPDAACDAFHRPLTGSKNTGFGHSKFVSHSALRRRNYVREDVLFVQVLVELGIMATVF